MSGAMNKIKDALGMGHHHSSHANASTTTAANCPECLAASGTTTGNTASYSSGANINPSLSSSSATYSTSTSGSAMPSSYSTTHTTGTTGHSTGVHADSAMTRSEEQLLVGKERVETGAAALKKTITTEHVSTTVPLVQEKVVLQREPITDANRGAAYSGAELKEAEHVVTTHAERPVVAKETVAKERVSLGKVAEVVNQTVGGEIRKEHITLEQGAPMASTTSTTSTMGTTDPLYNKDNIHSSTTSTHKTAY